MKKEKLTASQWNKLVKSGGVLDEQERIWYPTAGSLKGAMACKDFNVPEGINTDEEDFAGRSYFQELTELVSASVVM